MNHLFVLLKLFEMCQNLKKIINILKILNLQIFVCQEQVLRDFTVIRFFRTALISKSLGFKNKQIKYEIIKKKLCCLLNFRK